MKCQTYLVRKKKETYFRRYYPTEQYLVQSQSSTLFYATEQYFVLSHRAVLCTIPQTLVLSILFVLRFYGPVNPMGSCRAWSVLPINVYWTGLVL